MAISFMWTGICRIECELRALLSHELSHAAIYSWQREQMLGRGLSPNEAQELLPGWLHEAMAHCVELDFEPESANFRIAVRHS